MAWLKPQHLEEALLWLEQYQPRIVCGGTDLFVNWQMRKSTENEASWLNIQDLPELKQCKETDEGLEIGAAVTAAEIWQQATFNSVPALQQAARIVGGWQIQNRASIGGNLANASPAADMIVPLIAYKAVVRLTSASGTRSMPVAEFLRGPRSTALQTNELISSVLIPKAVMHVPQVFLRHDQRGGTDISIISVAVIMKGDRDQIEWARAAVGAASPVPYTLPELEEDWEGQMTAHKLADMAEKYAASSRPITDVRASEEYRRALVKVYIERAVKTICHID